MLRLAGFGGILRLPYSTIPSFKFDESVAKALFNTDHPNQVAARNAMRIRDIDGNTLEGEEDPELAQFVACDAIGRPVPFKNQSNRSPTAVVFMNMGGPRIGEDVHPFLFRLFSDKDLIPLPIQDYLGPWIARRRTPSIVKQYAEIGGGSPILAWTRGQAARVIQKLDSLSPETAPHRAYIAFRYAPPLTVDTVQQMVDDGVQRAIAFTQYPQYSCSTTGSSLNALHAATNALKANISFRVIDRWFDHPAFIQSMASLIERELQTFRNDEQQQAMILFSAHSLPMSVVNRGDTYPREVAATCAAVMKALHIKLPFVLSWQSQVGPSAWLGPQTSTVIEKWSHSKNRTRPILLVPIAFTSDHIETLYELDNEYVAEGLKNGLTGLRRVPALNILPQFIECLTDLSFKALKTDSLSPQLFERCPSCVNEKCGATKSFLSESKWATNEILSSSSLSKQG